MRVLVVALGGNDGLRGLPPDELQRNLAQIIERAQARGITVVLAGMEAPPNYGRDYIVAFHQVYPALARQYHVALVPFLLQGVAGIDALNQRDGIHPTAEGARIVADNVWAVLKPIVERGHHVIELRDVSKTVMSGTEPLTILHPLTLHDSRAASSSPSSGRRAAASRRCSASSPASMRRPPDRC